MTGTHFVSWRIALAAVGVSLAIGLTRLSAADAPAGQGPGSIDWKHARELFQKKQSGQDLTTEEQSYIDRVKAAYEAGARPPAEVARPASPAGKAPPSADGIDFDKAWQFLDKEHNGQTLTPEERAYLDRAKAAYQKGARPAGETGQPNPGGQRPSNLPPPPPPRDHTGLVPLDQMTAKDNYKGEDGGLYGGGQNVPPAKHQKAADAELAKIVPLGPDGKPAADGKIVLISIGMSNTTMEFSRFKQLADGDSARSPQVVIVDCAQGGQDAARWSDASLPAWQNAESRLRAAGVTPRQVQAVWMKHARISPAGHGEYPKHAEELKGHILASLNIAKQRFPNLRVAYLSSRIYAGYATTPLNPEPYAYESAFVVRSLIRDQIGGTAALNYDASAGEVKAPLLLWGPYLWADGVTPRKSDGLIWNRADLAGDGTHPSGPSGREKVAKLLLGFFTSDRNAKGWFTAADSKQ